jgi:RNA polymerase sigma-70 factor (ECF subfamily)
VTSTIGDRAEDTVRADAQPALVGPDGKALSWGDLFDEHAPALNYYARSRGVREPEDLVQEVFVAAFKQLPRFNGDRSGLRSLLFAIAYRRIADHHRRCYRRPETLVAEHSPRPDPDPTLEQIIDLDETAGEAMQALTVLSERERRVLEMRIVDEDSPALVGGALGLSSGNVWVIRARALVKLRNHLRAMGEEGLPMPVFLLGALSDSVRFLRTKLPADGSSVGGSKRFAPTRCRRARAWTPSWTISSSRWSTRRLVWSTKPLRHDKVDTLVDEAVQPMADETVEPPVHDLTDPLEDLVPGLDGLLGDR